jgi:hypothetical protein
MFKVMIKVTLLAALAAGAAQAAGPKPRVIVTVDPELDDSNSMIRFLLYSSDYNVEGLIYASSEVHWRANV